MLRTLWLTAERTSEFAAIRHPATADQVGLMLEFLDVSEGERQESLRELLTLLKRQQSLPPESRTSIPCRRPAGLFVLLPWRAAAWLARVMASPAAIVTDVQGRLTRWLSGQAEAQLSPEENKHVVAQPSLLG